MQENTDQLKKEGTTDKVPAKSKTKFFFSVTDRRVEVKVKSKAKAKILFDEGVSKILGGLPPQNFGHSLIIK